MSREMTCVIKDGTLTLRKSRLKLIHWETGDGNHFYMRVAGNFLAYCFVEKIVLCANYNL